MDAWSGKSFSISFSWGRLLCKREWMEAQTTGGDIYKTLMSKLLLKILMKQKGVNKLLHKRNFKAQFLVMVFKNKRKKQILYNLTSMMILTKNQSKWQSHSKFYRILECKRLRKKLNKNFNCFKTEKIKKSYSNKESLSNSPRLIQNQIQSRSNMSTKK